MVFGVPYNLELCHLTFVLRVRSAVKMRMKQMGTTVRNASSYMERLKERETKIEERPKLKDVVKKGEESSSSNGIPSISAKVWHPGVNALEEVIAFLISWSSAMLDLDMSIKGKARNKGDGFK
uniref:Uncharacterized protein n=1 Tax=Tanacetum cinerariifolium TaxID=118510 RepID=A0A699HCC7_TANCI|nr:hypothetical protein [Tanacetum cinerariifolium]